MKPGWTTVVLVGAAIVAFSGCTAPAEFRPPGESDPGVWELRDAESVTPDATVLELDVTRVDCSSGVTGKVLEPKVTYESARIVIETDLAALHLSAANCQGNPPVRVRLELTEPVGKRDLVDGNCLNREVATTSFCFTHLRWSGR